MRPADMQATVAEPISVVAALIDDGLGRVFLIRKRGTAAYMLAGGKADPGESPFERLARELLEELQFVPKEQGVRFLGTFAALAANEPDCEVEALIFHVRVREGALTVGAELDDGIWVSIDEARKLPLAPLARDHVLPLARGLCS